MTMSRFPAAVRSALSALPMLGGSLGDVSVVGSVPNSMQPTTTHSEAAWLHTPAASSQESTMYGIICIAFGSVAAIVLAAHIVARSNRVAPRATSLDPVFTVTSVASVFGIITGLPIIVTGSHWAIATTLGLISVLVVGAPAAALDAYLHPLTAAEQQAALLA